jgi:hypothetical protein
MKIKQRVFVTVSQVVNVLTGGMPDELLCSRMWRKKNADDKVGIVMVAVLNKIFFMDENHCKESYEDEINRRHIPSALKQNCTCGQVLP